MRSLLRPANLVILATYLLLSAVPFAPLLLGKTIDHPFRVVGIEFAAWLAAWAVFKRPAYFHWALIPAFIALPVELYLNVNFGQGISTHHLGIIVETSPKEAAEFLGDKIWLLLGVVLTISLWWALVWRVARGTRDLDLRGKPRWAAFGLVAIGLSVWLYGNEVGIQRLKKAVESSASSDAVSGAGSGAAGDAASGEDEEEDDEDEPASASAAGSAADGADTGLRRLWANFPKLPSWAALDVGKEQFGETWPFGLGVVVYDFWQERAYLAELSKKSIQFKFGAHQDPRNTGPQVVVLVIGESSRYDRWSLNGYKRETNPLLKSEANLVTMSNVVTAVSATRLAVPLLLTRKPATHSLKPGFSEKSVLSAFKEAGFKTYWLSNQMSYGEFDTPVSVFASEADVTQFLNLGGFTNNSNFDQVLLDPLKNALADPAQKKLIVIHTLGNHWNYSHRHPPEFDKWKPSLAGVQNPDFADPKLRQGLSNSYDNSILYVDWFLSQVIGSLKTSAPSISSLIYVSDHGETIYDGKCNLAFHGHNTEYDFHVPALVWYSSAYGAAYPAKIRQLMKNRSSALSSENIFHSLVDMGNVHYPSERLEWSFFSKNFKRHIRYVDSYGWTNYDHASLKGDCQEVIDKGTPLVQEK
ncbi:MAG: sulfatase-like hydrolase/transferase [Rhodocyclaceae bacterium]|nr:sulfatase-like hydrolase/transferase [Rhodocyclaceae bacterium]